jgi:hypothetical protein
MSAESRNYETSRDSRMVGKELFNTPVAKQWLSCCHVMVATDTQATLEELRLLRDTHARTHATLEE